MMRSHLQGLSCYRRIICYSVNGMNAISIIESIDTKPYTFALGLKQVCQSALASKRLKYFCQRPAIDVWQAQVIGGDPL